MKWGVRNYQNYDGTLTEAGRARYGKSTGGGVKDRYNKAAVEGLTRLYTERVTKTSGGDIDDATYKISKSIDNVQNATKKFSQSFDAKKFVKDNHDLIQRGLSFEGGDELIIKKLHETAKSSKEVKQAINDSRKTRNNFDKTIKEFEKVIDEVADLYGNSGYIELYKRLTLRVPAEDILTSVEKTLTKYSKHGDVYLTDEYESAIDKAVSKELKNAEKQMWNAINDGGYDFK